MAIFIVSGFEFIVSSSQLLALSRGDRYLKLETNTNETNRVTLESMRFFACAQNDALFVMLNAVKHLVLDRR